MSTAGVTMPDQPSDTFAASCVEVIEHCLDTPDDEHEMECDEEWFGWVEGLGERPGLYFAMPALGLNLPFMSAVSAWLYRTGAIGGGAPK